MNTLYRLFLAVMLAGLGASWAEASGSPYKLTGYATAGVNPALVFIVTDAQGNGVRGVPINVTCSTGVLNVVSGITQADGTLRVQQTSSSLGSIITSSCAQVSLGSPFLITTAAGQIVKNSDTVMTWFDESRRMFNAVVVTTGNGVLTTTSNFNFERTDYSSDYRYITLGQRAGIAQLADGTPAQVEVFQGTFSPGDRVYADETTVSGNPNGEAFFSSNQPNRVLFAYAVDGASPTVCAVVTDKNGVGVQGVLVAVTATAGYFYTAAGNTDVNGCAYFYLQGGALGTTVTVSCSGLLETSPVSIITGASQALQANDKIFSWYERKTRRLSVAVIGRQNQVLATSASSFIRSTVNFNSNDISPSLGAYLPQTKQTPATAYVAAGTSETGDLFRVVEDTVYRYPNNNSYYFHAVIEVPANETQYLQAFATGGMNPTVWGVITDGAGNALRGVEVQFAFAGGAAVSITSTATTWNGVAKSMVSGAVAYGNTITVSSPGLGAVKIFTADSRTVVATDRVLGWYDPETHKVFGAIVNAENNVMTLAGDNIAGRDALNKTSGNNVPTISAFGAQTQDYPCVANIGFGTLEAGDYIRLNEATTAANWDTVIVAAADPAKFLLAFAKGGVDPDVWAVVVDNKGNGLEGEPVAFSAAQGSMNLGNTLTGFGGYVIASHTSGLLGNTLTVSAPGLPPVTVITSDAQPGTGDDWGLAWYDAARLTLWGIITTQETNVVVNDGSSSYSNPVAYDMTANQRDFDVNGPVGHNFSRMIYRLNQWPLAFGTLGVGDEVALNMGYTSNNPDVFIRIGSVRSRYLKAYATSGANPTVKALVVDHNGVGIPGVQIYFNVVSGSGTMTGGPNWVTRHDGTVDASENGGALNDVIKVSSAGFPDVMIYTYNAGGVTASSPAVVWYAPAQRRAHTLMVQYPCYNVAVANSTPNVVYAPLDRTANQRTVAVTGAKEDSQQLPTYAHVPQGTSGAGDQLLIQTGVTYATNDALITLPADQARSLWAFGDGGTGGVNPRVWAVVTDADGNGLPGVPIRFVTTGGSMNLTTTVTDAAGMTVSAQSGGSLGNEIYVSADGVANTITVKATAAGIVESASRALTWYGVVDRLARVAFVNTPSNVLALSTHVTFTPVDTSSNYRSLALDATSQQTAVTPATVQIRPGTEGAGDQVWIQEATLASDPDGILSLSVPSSEIVSSLTASPSQVSTGQPITVRMPVFNNGSPAALTVTPSALNLAGNVSWVAGPTPGSWSEIPGGETREFQWVYTAPAAGDVIFTGQAFATDSFSLAPITSTATASNPVTVQTPPELACQWAVPDNAERLRDFTVTLTVSNAGQATAVSVTPVNVSWTGTAAASLKQGPLPASAVIPGNGQSVFAWVLTAGDGTGTLQMSGGAQGLDGNANTPVASASVESTAIEVIQGALNLERISSPDQEIYQGQKNLAVVMDVRNTSLLPVTLTAAALSFNGSPAGFTVLPAAGNPTWVAAQSLIQLGFNVAANSDAPLGHVVIDGTVSGDSEAGAMSAHGAPVTAAWTVLAPVNQLRQNYPNPLRLAQQAKTTFEYYLQTDEKATLKIYTLAGDVAAVLVDGSPGVGRHTVEWYGDNGSPGQRGKTVASGVYLAVLTIGEYKEIRKVVVVR